MPDILRVRYLGDTATIPLAGRLVETDTVFDLPAKVVVDDEAADHVVIEVGGQQWALPRALYSVETPRRRAARASDSTTGSEE